MLRFPASNMRPSIIGRDDFFVRYGDKEREAISSFDFLDDMSTASISGASSTVGSLQKLDTPVEQDHVDGLCGGRMGSAGEDGRATPPTPTPPEADSGDERTGTGGQLSLSESCGHSLSGSRSSLDEPPL